MFLHTASEFLEVGKFLLLGACAVGLFNILPPYDFLYLLMDRTPLAIAGMMILAVLLSVCSEADAFVAASFLSFPPASQLAFIVIGPMVDLKLILMYGVVFHRKVALLLVVVLTFLTYSKSGTVSPTRIEPLPLILGQSGAAAGTAARDFRSARPQRLFLMQNAMGADLLEQRPQWAANRGPMWISTRGASAGIPSGARFHHPGGIQAISRGVRP